MSTVKDKNTVFNKKTVATIDEKRSVGDRHEKGNVSEGLKRTFPRTFNHSSDHSDSSNILRKMHENKTHGTDYG